MKKSGSEPVNDSWFSSQLSNLDIDPDAGPLRAMDDVVGETRDIDLSNKNFISLFDLMSLFLLVDYCQAVYGGARLLFPGMGPNGEPALPIEDYYEERRKKEFDRSEKYEFSRNAYNLLAFCEHFGLFESLLWQHASGRVILSGITEELLDKLYPYSKAREEGSKVFGLLPIRGEGDVLSFRMESTIRSWVNALPPEIRQAPIFFDGEFSRVFGYQLALNMIEHSGSDFKGEYGALGAIAMRVLPGKSLQWIEDSFPETMKHVFLENNPRGVLEICAGDRGIGIIGSLKPALADIRERYGYEQGFTIKDIIAFAFDERGSSKPLDKRWGGVHALHRMLRCTVKYGGVLRLRTGGQEFVYNSANAPFNRHPSGLGIEPSSSNVEKILHPFGVQIQILLPLTMPERRTEFAIRQTKEHFETKVEKQNVRIVTARAYLESQSQKEDLRKLLITLSNSLMEESTERLIIFDFGGFDWSEEDIVFFLESQKSVLHTHKCIGLNLNSGLAKILRDRESMSIEDEGIIDIKSLYFLEVLSTKHRLLPILDGSNHVWWFGLGQYALDGCLNILFLNTTPSTPMLIRDIFVAAKTDATPRLIEGLDLYLKANGFFFEADNILERFLWHCKLKKSDFDRALELIIQNHLPQILAGLGCMHKGGLYKLPSRKEFTERFIQTTPLFQNEASALQLAELLGSAIRRIIGNENSKIVLVCATAPAELLAKSIGYALKEYDVSVLNLGHFTSIDEEKLLRADDWPIPAIIVADIVDQERTVGKIIGTLKEKDIRVWGLVGLLKFEENGKPNEIDTALFWDPPPEDAIEGKFPRYFLGKMRRPGQISEKQAWDTYGEDRLTFVEPFSLEVFRYSQLSGSGIRKISDREKLNRERLRLLEETGVLRAGHWVYGTHHFRLTASIRKMLDRNEIGGQICGHLLRIIRENKIDHVLIPLHSHIGDLLPRLLGGVKVTMGREIGYTFCISTRVLGDKPFYVMPAPVGELLVEAAINVRRGMPGLRLLIIDDAVATGGTLETLLRALMRGGMRAVQRTKTSRSPIEYVHVYAILDRQGRHKRTVWTGMTKLDLYGNYEGPGVAAQFPFEFKFERWIDLEFKVDERNSCELCTERAALLNAKKFISHPQDDWLFENIEDRIKEIQPHWTEIPSFEDYEQLELSQTIEIGRFEAKTVELALLEYYNLWSRGVPSYVIISEYEKIDAIFQDQKRGGIRKQSPIEYLKREMGRVFFQEWNLLCSQWTADRWIRVFEREIDRGSKVVAADLLGEAGKALAKASEGRQLLEGLLSYAISRISHVDDEVDPEYILRRNLGLGCLLYLVYFRSFSGDADLIEKEFWGKILGEIGEALQSKSVSFYSGIILQEIAQAIRLSSFKDDFIPALLTVLDHTLRYRRHRHSHLLPFGLEKICFGHGLSKVERDAVRNGLREFMHCLDVTKQRLPTIFNTDAEELSRVLKGYIDALAKELEIEELNEKSRVKLVSLANDVQNLFPTQLSSSIFNCLRDTQVSLLKIKRRLQKQCIENVPSIDFRYSETVTNSKELTLMAPSFNSVIAALQNFTLRNPIDPDYCKAPRVLMSVEEGNTLDVIRRIRIRIFTNFQPSRNAKAIMSGPGLKELAMREFRIFGIRPNPNIEFDPVAPDGMDYSVCLSLEFYAGYPQLTQNEGDEYEERI